MLTELSAEQSRQVIDVEQVFQVHQNAVRELQERFAGSMLWQKTKGRKYLSRVINGVRHSLGARSPETEAIYEAFSTGREEQRERRDATKKRLEEMARVNKALRLNRVPAVAARIIRRLDKIGLLGRNVIIVGTNALYAYEAAAAMMVSSDLLATGDVDLLYDSRRQLELAVEEPKTLIGLLKKVDRSFAAQRGSFSAANKEGYMVDLIAPQRGALRPSAGSIGGDEDMSAAEIEGLVWLENAPKFERMVIGEDGMPLRMIVPDPRAFAAHKFWMANRPDRSNLKKDRDHAQAGTALVMAKSLPNMELESPDLQALPGALRKTLLSNAN